MRHSFAGILLCCLGTSTAWAQQELAVISFNAISEHATRLEPMLQQVRAGEWVAKGAPETYVEQLTSVLRQFEGIRNSMAALAQHPDRMADCIKALFAIETSHQTLGSLLGGLRKYQNPALADLIESVAAEDRVDIERIQQYVLDLAKDKEAQFEVMDREAQRCRGTLSRQPGEPARTIRR